MKNAFGSLNVNDVKAGAFFCFDLHNSEYYYYYRWKLQISRCSFM